ncbi:RNA 3'-terminal phosphate cyclase-like [Diadema antillarum]|uniref:RNA 3'-terminal phosphate cyclase-like n=1 Tax=Diadema antillarum TaxID=105358 RepID=UPI003A89E6B2
MAASAIIVDGSLKEGGGQILRIATALSCLCKKPITVNNIRANRSKPGLRPQHLTGIQLVNKICGGSLTGGVVGSSEITFSPANIAGGKHVADTGTAGSVVLLMQVSLPCLLYASGDTHVTLKGGTNAEMAPQIDYMNSVFQPMAEKFGLSYECRIARRGFYPKGGGEIQVSARPLRELQPVTLLDVGQVSRVTGRSFVAGSLPRKLAQIMASTASSLIKKAYPGTSVNIETVQESAGAAVGNGSGIMLVAETTTGCRIAGSSLGKRGKQAEDVGREAAEELLKNLKHGGCVDEYLQDQLIIFMALAKGQSRVKTGPVTLHTETAIHIAELLTEAKFKVSPVQDGSGEGANIIECTGVGLINHQV